jgi:hypothetical protein
MILECRNGRCNTPRWMGRVLFAAGLYHLLFAAWVMLWPHLCFDWLGLARPNHPMIWRGVGLLGGVLGIGFLIAARDPVQHWLIVLIGFVKPLFVATGLGIAMIQKDLPPATLWIMLVDDLVWIPPFASILWSCLQAHAGVPPSRSTPLGIDEAAEIYRLSDGRTLGEASASHTLVLVFLRHFGCTFTRQILRGLEKLQAEAHSRDARLVLVHMLQSGEEARYLGERSGLARIADPRCELYRAFGLGKGGFLELFGPHVWWRGAISVLRGCGVGHLAGDGLQMPGAFLFRNGRVIAAQRAQSAADLPDLPQLFKGLPSSSLPDTVSP